MITAVMMNKKLAACAQLNHMNLLYHNRKVFYLCPLQHVPSFTFSGQAFKFC